MAVSRSSAMTRLPHETSEPDQACFGSVDIALAGKEIGAGRPTDDRARPGQILVLDAGRNVRESLPCRRRQEHDRQTKCAGASFDDAASTAEAKGRYLRVGRTCPDELAEGQARTHARV